MHNMRKFQAYLYDNPGAGFIFVVVLFSLSFLLRIALNDSLPPGYPFLTFFPAIVLSAVLAGVAMGALCGVLSSLAAWYFFLPPYGSFALSASTGLAMAFFAGVILVDLLLVYYMQNASRRLAEEKEITSRLYEQQTVLFQELQHRVANNIAFISSLLSLERARVRRDPAHAADAFEAAIARIEVIGQMHRRLYDPEAIQAPLSRYLRDLATDLLKAAGRSDIELHVSTDEVPLDMQQRMSVSMLISELVINSMKYGLAQAAGPQIWISLKRTEHNMLRVDVRDNGPGFPPGFDPETSEGLGSRILTSLARQLDGHIRFGSSAGARVSISFPVGAEGTAAG